MNIIYVQSQPLYRYFADNGEFLEFAERDKWMPALTVQRGYPSELWVVGKVREESQWQYDDLPPLPVKVFEADQRNGAPDTHTSAYMNKSAAESGADLFVINGLEGGAGIDLAKKVLIPRKIPFAVILENECYHSIVKHTCAVLYQAEWQRRQLTRRSLRFWRKVVDPDQLIHLPKSVDTRHFTHDADAEKEFAVIASGRLDTDTEGDYDALFELSKRLQVAFIGGGPLFERYRRKFPEIRWYGKTAYEDLPGILNKGELFFHSCYRNSHPQSIAEAAACGVPPVAFADVVDEDILPDHIGLRVSNDNFLTEIDDLLDNPERMQKLSQAARRHATQRWHHESSVSAIREMIKIVRSSVPEHMSQKSHLR